MVQTISCKVSVAGEADLDHDQFGFGFQEAFVSLGFCRQEHEDSTFAGRQLCSTRTCTAMRKERFWTCFVLVGIFFRLAMVQEKTDSRSGIRRRLCDQDFYVFCGLAQIHRSARCVFFANIVDNCPRACPDWSRLSHRFPSLIVITTRRKHG